jgi:hypothetical protein
MAERGSRTPASGPSAAFNVETIFKENPGLFESLAGSGLDAHDISKALRGELEAKGLKGFRRGGKVKKTGVAKVHKGERVLTAKQAKKPAVKRAVARKTPAPHGRRKSPSRPARR